MEACETGTMLVKRAFSYELDPTNKQRASLFKAAGTARLAWNWGLQEYIRGYNEKEGASRFTNALELHIRLNRLKETDYPWMNDVSKCVPQEAP